MNSKKENKNNENIVSTELSEYEKLIDDFISGKSFWGELSKFIKIGLIIHDHNNIIITVNKYFVKISGWRPREIIGKNIDDFISTNIDDFSVNSKRQSGIHKFNAKLTHKSGEKTSTRTASCKIPYKGKKLNVIVIEDLTELIESEKKRDKTERRLVHNLFYDYKLTGLPNIDILYNYLRIQVIRQQERHTKDIFAVACLGLDKFNKINDFHGKHIGDRLLRTVAQLLAVTTREDDVATRYEGDKFLILLSNIHNIQDINMIIPKILNIFAEPFLVEGRKIKLNASIGISIFPYDVDESELSENKNNADLLIEKSEAAMLKAKEKTDNSYMIFDQLLHEEMKERITLGKELPTAFSNNEFLPYYQPIVSMIDQNRYAIIGLEVLIRWKSTRLKKFIPPDKFIPIAEKYGMIKDIGNFILDKSFNQIREWESKGYPLFLSINISPLQLEQDLINFIEELTNKLGAGKEWLKERIRFEITETAYMEDKEKSLGIIKKIRELGIPISIDDFGTGLSTLQRLNILPIDTLKIDKSFIDSMLDSEQGKNIVTGIIGLAHNLNKKIVAEGIETREQLNYLIEHRCDSFQGYFFDKPMPSEEIDKKLSKQIIFNTD